MGKLQIGGRILLGIAMAGFGIAQFATQHFLKGLLPFGELPLYRLWTNIISLLFLVTGFLFMQRKSLRFATVTAGILFLLFFVYPHSLRLFADPYNGSKWTGAFECLAISSGSVLTGVAQKVYGTSSPVWMNSAVRYIFALCLLVYGIQHFLYASFIATLIPDWMPAHLFWAYFVGVAFTATALSLASGVLARLSTMLLALMFFIWVLILHAPRVVAHPNIEPEWTSMFVALAMGAIALQISRLPIRKASVEERNVKSKEFIIHP